MDKDEILQNDIIRVLRHYFNDKPCKEWTTGFHRHCAKDVINLVRQDIDIDNTDEVGILKNSNKALALNNIELSKRINQLEDEIKKMSDFINRLRTAKPTSRMTQAIAMEADKIMTEIESSNIQ